jgi:tRNA/rRNA methyltransferase
MSTMPGADTPAALYEADGPEGGSTALHTRFILVQPSHAGNVGAAARAMKVMGFQDLVLVQPRFDDVLQRAETQAMASGATDVLQSARCVDSLAAALQGITWAGATAMTPRDFGPPVLAPRACFEPLAASAHRVAFVFGPERTGLSNDDVYRCHACLSIPTDPAYGSLNLAQAVQLIAYDWRQALGGYAVQARTAPPQWADGLAVQGLLVHWQQALQDIGFLDPDAPKKLMPRLQQLSNRAQLTVEEIHILRGIARAMQTTAATPTGAASRKRDVESGHGPETAHVPSKQKANKQKP